MALRGNLKDFSLPDVFQLVTFSRKSGVLRIERADGAKGSVWFREGDVFFAQSNWHSELLGERLVRAQRITPQALERALTARSEEGEDGRRLGAILVDEGYITEKVLEVFVSEQIQETIFDLMRWDEGDFDFEATPETTDEDIGLSVSIENVVMEGSRRLEEWTRIRKKIPSMDVVFKMATAPGEGTFEISLKPTEWNLLLLVDGTRSVAELAYATNRTDFEVARVVYGLFSAGLLEFASDEEIEKLRAERDAREAKLAEIEAERKEAEAAQAAATQAREEALQAEAEARAQVGPEPAPSAGAEAAETAPAELPEFLAGGVGPTAEDAAVLEEMMGAVLRPAPAPVAAPEPEPELVAEPQPEPELVAEAASAVVEEPAAAAEFAPIPEPEPEPEPVVAEPEAYPFVPVAQVSDLVEPEASVEAAEARGPSAEATDDTLAQIQASLAGLAEPPAAPEVVALPEPALAPAEPEAAGVEFERDLMALGLGELPPELAEEPVEIVVPPRDEASAETVAAPAEWVEEAVEPLGVAPQAEAPEAAELGEAVQTQDAEQFVELAESFEPSPYTAVQPAEDVAEAAPDFAELLESLDYEEAAPEVPVAAAEAPAVEPEAPPVEPEALAIEPEALAIEPEVAPSAAVDSLYEAMPDASFDFDEELLREVSPDVEVGGVISTDAFLEDIGGDMDFSGGLTDELSALTGLGRPSRPTASVNKIPEPAAGGDVLRRDTRVDKDTLLKIIDGIKNL